MELIAALDKSFNHMHGVMLGVGPEHYAQPTPCKEWNVRELLDHSISVVAGLAATASGSVSKPEFELAEDPAAQFRELADANLEAWSTPGVMEQIVNAAGQQMPGSVLAGINLLDTTTHAWDLAVALGRPVALPDDVAELALEQSRMIISQEIRPGRFDAEVTPPADATATDLLVAYLGRNPR